MNSLMRATSARWWRSSAPAIVDVSLEEATRETKTVDMDLFELAGTFFG